MNLGGFSSSTLIAILCKYKPFFSAEKHTQKTAHRRQNEDSNGCKSQLQIVVAYFLWRSKKLGLFFKPVGSSTYGVFFFTLDDCVFPKKKNKYGEKLLLWGKKIPEIFEGNNNIFDAN